MIGRIVEIAGQPRRLHVDRGFLVVTDNEIEIGRVPLDDIGGLICNSYGLTITASLLVALTRRGCPVVLCGSNHSPAGTIWPTDSHHLQAHRLDLQLAASLPLRKRLWREIVRSKLAMQAETLVLCGKSPAPVLAMGGKVRSGDTGNVEGQAARVYWRLLMGGDFHRDAEGDGVNGMLNYGYVVLRSAVARQCMATGLNPGIPLHHANDGNPMRLVDDLMEPFRPAVDAWVWKLVRDGKTEVDVDVKRLLGTLPSRSFVTPIGVSPLTLVVQRACLCLVAVFAREKRRLELPVFGQGALSSLWDEPSFDEERDSLQQGPDQSTAALRLSPHVADGDVRSAGRRKR